jgi:hypothetical protein
MEDGALKIKKPDRNARQGACDPAFGVGAIYPGQNS